MYGIPSASLALVASVISFVGASWGFGTSNEYLVMPTLKASELTELQKQLDNFKLAIVHGKQMRILKKLFFKASLVSLIMAMFLAFMHRAFPHVM